MNFKDISSVCHEMINIIIPTISKKIAPSQAEVSSSLLIPGIVEMYIIAATAPPTLKINSIPCGAKMQAMPSVILTPAFFFRMGGVKKYPLRPGVISPTIIPPMCERKTGRYFIRYPILVSR